MKLESLNGIRVLLIAEQRVYVNNFYNAWEKFNDLLDKSTFVKDEHVANIFAGSVVKGLYVADSPDNKGSLKDHFTLDLLKHYKNITITVIIGEFNQQDHFWINVLMHQCLLGDVVVFDPQIEESPMPIHVAEFCKDLEYDVDGMVKDLFTFFFGRRGANYYENATNRNLGQRSVS